MSRYSIMTTGIVLILIGIQLNLVESYVMTPRFSQFWNERLSAPLYTTENIPPTPNIPIAQTSSRPYSGYPFNGSRYGDYTTGTPALQASYSQVGVASTGGPLKAGFQKQFSPPRWICWPLIFLGAVIFLHGATLGRSV